MTTIPNLNVVIQQGGNARDAQNVKNQPQNVFAEPQTPDKAIERLSTVNEFEESEKTKFEKDKEESSKRREKKNLRMKSKEKKKKKNFENPEGIGRLLNTVV